MSEVDLLNEASTDVLESLFAGADALAVNLARQRPFVSAEQLFDLARRTLDSLSRQDQIEIVNGHPRLGASPAILRSGHGLSFEEQRGGLSPADPLAAELDAANERYEARFGFRFVTFVNGRPLQEMPSLIATRLARSDAEELHDALDAIVAIARHRLEVITARRRVPGAVT